MDTDATIRAAMIEAALRQLAGSSDHDVATRAVCEAVGVTQPVLYRLFGDKRGLLDAVADHGYERYTALKTAKERTEEPVADLLAGWDGHMAFAEENPALYRLMFAPGRGRTPPRGSRCSTCSSQNSCAVRRWARSRSIPVSRPS